MINIVIIENSFDHSELVSKLLSKYNDLNIVGTFYDGKTALEKIPLLKPDIALVEIGLKDMCGVECIQNLKNSCKTTDFMVWTHCNEEKIIIKSLESGVSSYILKTASQDFLLKAIQDLQAGGSPMSPEISRIILNKLFKTPKRIKNIVVPITSRERQVLELLSEGFLYKEIAEKMNISVNTLKTHCYNLYQKFEVSNKIEAINFYNTHHLKNVG